jgi:hypothetical protein
MKRFIYLSMAIVLLVGLLPAVTAAQPPPPASPEGPAKPPVDSASGDRTGVQVAPMLVGPLRIRHEISVSTCLGRGEMT